MAITIQQDPTTPNIANSNLVFTVTSTQYTQAQFQYVVDIKDKNDTLIHRIKQQPNPSGKGVFDVAQILVTELGPTDLVWEIDTAVGNTACGKEFNIYFGEEYGTSPSSSVTSYTGVGTTTGSAAVSGSDYYFNLDGNVGPNELVNWNWDSGSKYQEEEIDDITFSHQFGLTNFNTSSVYSTDYHTISLLNGNLYGGVTASQAQDIFAMIVTEYDSAGSTLATTTYYNNYTHGTPASASVWGNIYTSQSEDTRLIHWPAGPQNFDDAGNTLNASTTYYTCKLVAQQTDGSPNTNGVWGEYTFNIGECSGFTPLRFAWKNEYGVWDYFSFTKAQNTNTSITREQYKQTFVNFSTTANTTSYSPTRRGGTQYYNEIAKDRQANSDWLTQTDADNLRELFFSTNVYVYEDSKWIPVVLTDASITEKTNNLSQKVFQYSVNYRHANEVRARV